MVLHAHMEVSPRHTHPLWREGTRCTVGSVIVAERALLAKCSGTWGGAVMVAVGWCRLLPVWVCPPGTLSCLQAAAVRDARGMLPLALAAQTGACAGVKDMLYEAYPEATAGVALHEVLLWGAKAVSHAISAQPEVQCEMSILPSMLLLLHHVPCAGRMCTCDLQPMCGWWCPYAEGVRCSTGSCYSYYCKVAKLGCELVTALPERRTPCFVASCFVRCLYEPLCCTRSSYLVPHVLCALTAFPFLPLLRLFSSSLIQPPFLFRPLACRCPSGWHASVAPNTQKKDPLRLVTR